MYNGPMQWTQVLRVVAPFMREQTPEVTQSDDAARPMQC